MKKGFIRREEEVWESKKTRLGCKTIKCKSGKGKSTRLRCKKVFIRREGEVWESKKQD